MFLKYELKDVSSPLLSPVSKFHWCPFDCRIKSFFSLAYQTSHNLIQLMVPSVLSTLPHSNSLLQENSCADCLGMYLPLPCFGTQLIFSFLQPISLDPPHFSGPSSCLIFLVGCLLYIKSCICGSVALTVFISVPHSAVE